MLDFFTLTESWKKRSQVLPPGEFIPGLGYGLPEWASVVRPFFMGV